MKKVITMIFVSLIICCTLFASGSTEDSASSNGKYKIGVILYGKEDTLGGRIYSLLNDCGKALDCEIVYSFGDYDTTAQLTAAENLIAAGAKGIIVLPLAETSSQKIGALCKENGVYFGLLLRTVNDETIAKEVRSNPYFVGNILGDDVGNAKELTRILIEENGRKNLCMYYAAKGTSMALRNTGIQEAVEEFGAVQLAEATCPSDGNMAPVTSNIQNFVNTNATIDGIISAAGSGGIGETINSCILSMPSKDIKYACFDTFSGMLEAFNNNTLVAVCGGQAPAAVYLFSMLYNAIDGHRLTESGQELLMSYIFLRTAEEAENFNKYIDNPEVSIYSAEEIRNMTVRYNASFDWNSLKQIMKDYSYANIMAKIQ